MRALSSGLVTDRLGALKTRWAAIGAAVAVSLGAGGIGIASATISSGDKAVYAALAAPKRIVDTRDGTGLSGKLVTDQPRNKQVTGNIPVRNEATQVVVPAGASAVSLSVTVFQPQAGGFLAVRPAGTPGRPKTANVNFPAGSITNNAVNIDLPANGQLELWLATSLSGGTADVIVDVLGFYEDHHHDDRYYTKSESETAFQPRGVVGPRVLAFGNIDFDASVGANSYGVEFAIWNNANDRYEIAIPGLTARVDEITTATLTGDQNNCPAGATIRQANALNRLYIYIEAASGTNIQCSFDFVTFAGHEG